MRAKGIIFVLTILFSVHSICAQTNRPVINGLSKYIAPPGEKITINGANFVTNSQVSFGAGVAAFNFISSTQLEVTVPTNATYAPVTVTNLSSGLSGSSSRSFTMSFGGSTLSAAGFDNVSDQFRVNEIGQRLIWDVCLCDLDEDNDLDAVTTHRDATGVNVYRNVSTFSTTLFNINTTLTAPTDNSNIILCDDLDGNGKKDLVISSVSTTLFNIRFFSNNSSPGSINLVNGELISLPRNSLNANRSSFRIQLVDLDGDGKKDLIVGSDTEVTVNADAKFFIYKNTSSLNSISFDSANPTEISLPDGSESGLLDFGELNGDNLPDIVVTPNGNGSVYFLKNKSRVGFFEFNSPTSITANASRDVIKLADFNNDGLSDLAYTDRTNGSLTIFANTTSSANSDISFVQTDFLNITLAWGIDAGDLNGDGLVDLVVSSLSTGLRVLENTSTTNIDFANPITIEVQRNPNGTQQSIRNIKIGDLNGDAKPDIAITLNSVDRAEGIFSVIANRNCLEPTIFPTPTDISFCYDLPFTLSAPKAFGVTYNWEAVNAPGTNFALSGEEVTITVPSGSPTTVDIKVTITSNDGKCTDEITQSYSAESVTNASARPTIINDKTGTICGGDAFTLSSSVVGDAYLWTLPDGSTSNDAQIIVSNAQNNNAGSYSLRVQESGKCYSDPSNPILVDIDVPPTLTIINQDGNENFCVGSDVTLEVPSFDNFTLEWFKDGITTNNSNNTIDVTTSGSYTVAITSAANCVNTSTAFEVFAIAEPSAMISSESEICVGIPIDFQATSTGEAGFSVTHSWDFKDGNTATGVDVSNTFTTAGTYQVELTTSYDNVDLCEDQMTISVVVTDIPTINIVTNPAGNTLKCPSDSVRLELPQNYESYLWSTGDTDFFTYAKTEPGQSSVEITADVTTDVGCVTTTESITISNHPGAGISITAEGFPADSDTIMLEAGVVSVKLTAFTAGGQNYIWSTNDLRILTSETGNETEVFPREAFTTVTVTAEDGNECNESQSIVLEKPGLQPRKAFSPNGDGQNDCWEIINSENQTGCTIYIIDTRGVTIFEGDSPFVNNCIWNGEVNGSGGDAAEGIYFYVLKCDDKSSSQTGSILLAR